MGFYNRSLMINPTTLHKLSRSICARGGEEGEYLTHNRAEIIEWFQIRSYLYNYILLIDNDPSIIDHRRNMPGHDWGWKKAPKPESEITQCTKFQFVDQLHPIEPSNLNIIGPILVCKNNNTHQHSGVKDSQEDIKKTTVKFPMIVRNQWTKLKPKCYGILHKRHHTPWRNFTMKPGRLWYRTSTRLGRTLLRHLKFVATALASP